MHRVLSVQMSRSENNESSEFVSKRLCCSFLFTVAFFTILGGFLLGRYTSNRTLFLNNRHHIKVILNKVLTLQNNISNTFQHLHKNCNCAVTFFEAKCNRTAFFGEIQNDDYILSELQNDLQKITGTLDLMIACFND